MSDWFSNILGGSKSWQDNAQTYQPPSSNQPAYTVNTPKYEPQTPSAGSSWFVDTMSKYEAPTVNWQDTAAQYQPPGVSASGGDDSWWDDVWDWAKSDQGLDIIGGASKYLFDAYQREKMYERGKAASAAGGGGPSAAELQDARIKKHNESINKPMDMGMRKLKR